MTFIEELRKKGMSELATQLDELRQQLFAMRFQNAVGKLENTQHISQVRRKIAQLLTIIWEKQHAEPNDKTAVEKTPSSENKEPVVVAPQVKKVVAKTKQTKVIKTDAATTVAKPNKISKPRPKKTVKKTEVGENNE